MFFYSYRNPTGYPISYVFAHKKSGWQWNTPESPGLDH